MDESFDSVDNINQYVNPDKVKPAHHSERDKDRKFSRTLKEQMEENLEKKKKKKKDILVLGDQSEEELASEAREDEPEHEESEPDSEPTEPNPEDKQDNGHIDLKA